MQRYVLAKEFDGWARANVRLQNFNPDVKEKASIYVPAIGKVTIVILLRNLLRMVVQSHRELNDGD